MTKPTYSRHELDGLNAVTVSVDHLSDYLDEMQACESDAETGVVMTRWFKRDRQLFKSLFARGAAFRRLIEQGVIDKWITPLENGDAFILQHAEAVYRAVATLPLMDCNGEPGFDAEQFETRVLQLAVAHVGPTGN